jgi:hypothetical protein
MSSLFKIFAIGSCRVKGMRTFLPKAIDFSFLENHLHSPYELVQWLNIVCDLENLSSMPDEFVSTLLSCIDEVHLRGACSISDTLQRYLISLGELKSSDVVLVEVSSAKDYASGFFTYNGESVHANILCMNTMRINQISNDFPEKARIMSRDEIAYLVEDFLVHPAINGKKVILVPHFQFEVPGNGFIKERQVIQEVLLSTKETSANFGSLAIYDPSLLAVEVGVEELFCDSSHYNKERLESVADRISEIASDFFRLL